MLGNLGYTAVLVTCAMIHVMQLKATTRLFLYICSEIQSKT